MLWMVLLFAVLAALLCVPIHVDVSIRRDEKLEVQALSRWGGFGIPSPGKPPSHKTRRAPRTGRTARARPAPNQLRRLRALLFSRDFLSSLARLFRRLLRQVQPRGVTLRLRAGLGDPADTGRLWGKLMPLFALLWALDAESITLEPDFSRPCLTFDGHATIRVVPGLLLAVLLGYCFTPPPWRALSQYLRAR